jgi:diguanylate cyclase (GGDEF)-like protein
MVKMCGRRREADVSVRRVTRARWAPIVGAIALAFLGSLAAAGATSPPVSIESIAQRLMPSALCAGDAAQIATLPESCFVPETSVRIAGTATIFRPAMVTLRFPAPPPAEPRLLHVSTYITDGRFTILGAHGEIVQSTYISMLTPLSKRSIRAHELVFPVHPYPRGATMVLQMTSPFEQLFPDTDMQLVSASAYAEHQRAVLQNDALPLAFLNGIATAMGLYNLILFLILRRRMYGLYAAAILTLVLYQVIATGAAWTVLWPNLGVRDDYPSYIPWMIYFVLIVAFTRTFLRLPEVAPRADRVLIGALVVLLVENVVYVTVPDLLYAHGLFDALDPILTSLMFMVMIGVGIIAWRRGVSAAPVYVLAFTGSAIGLIVGDAATFDEYSTSLVFSHLATSIGVAWESIVLAIALGQRVRAIEDDAKRFQAEAYHDPLTRIGNRRAFDETLEREWRRAQRTSSPLAVIIFDIDFFKQYNDRFGHMRGDACLVAVAAAIAAAARRPGDFAARYGGEEFAMILPGAAAADAGNVAERVRLSLRGADPIEVTVSAGCAAAIPQMSDEAGTARLIATADAALYRAKDQGRDRVVIA